MVSRFAPLPKPPYYAVTFAAQLSDDRDGYDETANRMVTSAQSMPGFLGIETTRDEQGFGITISYWESEEAVKNWRDNSEHTLARKNGRNKWYTNYTLRVAKVERAYEMKNVEIEND